MYRSRVSNLERLAKELGSSLPDGVASPETNPLRDGTVLLLSFGKLLLGAERLVALLVQ